MNQKDIQLIDQIKRYVRQAIFYCHKAHQLSIESEVNKIEVIGYLQRASAKMSAAESIYWSNFDIAARDEAEEIFSQFDQFADEIVESIPTGHSAQWVDIEYDRLIDLISDTEFEIKET